jgi:hypothetical protein
MGHHPVFQVDGLAVPTEELLAVGGEERAGTDVG